MHDHNGSPEAFALFDKSAHAWAALEVITHLPFDNNVHLRCEMARKDMYLKASSLELEPLRSHSVCLLPFPAALDPSTPEFTGGRPIFPPGDTHASTHPGNASQSSRRDGRINDGGRRGCRRGR